MIIWYEMSVFRKEFSLLLSHDAQRTDYYNIFDGKPQCFFVMKDFISAKHVHKETEIAFPLNGDINVVVRENVFHVHMQELLIIPGNVMHHYEKKDADVDVVNVKFMDEWLAPQFSGADELDQLKNFFRSIVQFGANPFLSTCMNNMINHDHKAFSDYYIWGCLIEMIAQGLNNQHWIKRMVPVDIENSRYIEDMLLFVREHCYENLTLKMLAEHVGLTESYCSKYFKQCVGTSFLEYVTTRRVSHAQRLLKYTDSSITEIVEKSGFSSIQTFNRVFKQYIGMTPSQYRKA